MSNLGKKILSAFVEVRDEETAKSVPAHGDAAVKVTPGNTPEDRGNTAHVSSSAAGSPNGVGQSLQNAAGQSSQNDARQSSQNAAGQSSAAPSTETSQRFAEYFDKLFNDANLPGPDYYEFSKMIGAMHLVPDERARYFAAYAGLQVQGLDKQKLLSTAAEYVKILDADASRFQQTVDAAVQEKVSNRSAEAEEKAKRIVLLTQEIQHLRDEIAAIEEEVRQNQEKLSVNGNAYAFESQRRKQQISNDIEKINQYIQ